MNPPKKWKQGILVGLVTYCQCDRTLTRSNGTTLSQDESHEDLWIWSGVSGTTDKEIAVIRCMIRDMTDYPLEYFNFSIFSGKRVFVGNHGLTRRNKSTHGLDIFAKKSEACKVDSSNLQIQKNVDFNKRCVDFSSHPWRSSWVYLSSCCARRCVAEENVEIIGMKHERR